jgi:hypothetical protein
MNTFNAEFPAAFQLFPQYDEDLEKIEDEEES